MKRLDYIYITLLGLLALTAGCTDDFEPRQAPDRLLLPGEYYFVLASDDAGSRVAYPDEVSSTFETGDRIGVFATNVEKQIQNDVFAARPINGDTPIQVLAPPTGNVTQELDTEIPKPGTEPGGGPQYLFYYPMNPDYQKRTVLNNGTGFSYTVEADQSTKENFQKSDFLWCYLEPDKDAAYQTVEMHHLMASIVVKVHKDSIDSSNGVTLHNVMTVAQGIKFATMTEGNMNYSAPEKSKSDIKMYCQGESGEYLVYRAAVPAWNTIEAGKEIFTLTLFDRNGNPVETTYKLAADQPLELRDGYYYTFTLRSAVKPAIPDVSDDDSWVLDVFYPGHEGDPDYLVGLLCREYVRYQPDIETTDFDTRDQRTGTKAKNGDYNLSSQAWVFYNLKESSKYPELKEGTVLRFLYDIIASVSQGLGGTAKADIWPAPHRYGGSGFTAGGIFTARHGHEWVQTSEGYGGSSQEWQEYYLHGGKIEWERTTGTYGEFFRIKSFTPRSETQPKITNATAANLGHIAIPKDGSKPYVSYSEISEDGVTDADDCWVGVPVPKYLRDDRDTAEPGEPDNIISYPIVKIGYNNFWTMQSLKSTELKAGTPLRCFNKSGVSYDDVSEQKFFLTFDNDNPVTEAGYLYSHTQKHKFDVYNMCSDRLYWYPKLYNYLAVRQEGFIPPAKDGRLITYLPTEMQLDRTISYFGWKFAGKIMTSHIYTRIGAEGGESGVSALYDNKIYPSDPLQINSYTANISGFNLRANGFFMPYQYYNDSYGQTCSFWLGDNITAEDGVTDSKPIKIFNFEAYSPFDAKNAESLISNIGNYPGKQMAGNIFTGVRILIKFKGQEDSNDFDNGVTNDTPLDKLSMKSNRSPIQVKSNDENRVVHLDLIRK